MIHIKDNFGIVRPPKPAERFAMRDGSLYTIDRAGSLRAVQAERRSKRLTPGKQRRKERRAIELEATRRSEDRR